MASEHSKRLLIATTSQRSQNDRIIHVVLRSVLYGCLLIHKWLILLKFRIITFYTMKAFIVISLIIFINLTDFCVSDRHTWGSVREGCEFLVIYLCFSVSFCQLCISISIQHTTKSNFHVVFAMQVYKMILNWVVRIPNISMTLTRIRWIGLRWSWLWTCNFFSYSFSWPQTAWNYTDWLQRQ